MEALIKELLKSKKFNSYIEEIKNKVSPVILTGLTDVAKTYFTYATSKLIKQPIFIITYNEIQARRLLKDIQTFNSNAIFIPKKEIVTYDYIAESKELPYERIEALNKIQENNAEVVITTIEAIMQPMISKEVLYKDTIYFKIGASFDIEQLKQKLINLGYERAELIEGRGQFTVRGGIVDISISQNKGVRIEFWGDEVDSIRYFNISSQRSTDMINEIKIYPAHEYILEKNIDEVCEEIEKINQNEQDIELIRNGNYISKIDKYFSSFYAKKSNLLEYINENYIISKLDEENY